MALVPHARRLLVAVLAALPIIAWPGLSHPFSTPKLWTLVTTVLALAPIAWLASRRRALEVRSDQGDSAERGVADERAEDSRLRAMPRWLVWVVAMWLVSWCWSSMVGDVVSLDALLLALASALLAVIITIIAPPPQHVAMAMVIGATAVALVAAGQWMGADVFALAGWVPPIAAASARLRVYGTLGNPNFVAALLAATLPLTLSLALWMPRGGHGLARWLLFVAMGIQTIALIATGSRGGALGVLVAALTLVFRWRRKGALVAFAMVGCVVALLAIGVSTARPLSDTAAGRAYIVRVAWAHAFEAPWAGRGPGAFELLYPSWELRGRGTDPGGAARFGGPQQHAHNDYLEALIERGLLGPVTILVILATCFWNGWRHTRAAGDGPLLAGTLAMLAALAAMACVDFPLARPTEATWFWCGVALIALMERRG